jgi:hypothetical protein
MSNLIKPFNRPSSFEKLGDKLFFNIFVHKPDDLVYHFIKRYFPSFTKKFKTGGWTIYSGQPGPVFDKTIHSFRFAKHPHFNAKFREGRLDLLSSEGKDLPAGIIDFQLWFMFDSKKDGEAGFDRLAKMFMKVSASQAIRKIGRRKIAHFTDQKELTTTNAVEFILTEDELHDGKCKMLFRWGAFTYPAKNGA